MQHDDQRLSYTYTWKLFTSIFSEPPLASTFSLEPPVLQSRLHWWRSTFWSHLFFFPPFFFFLSLPHPVSPLLPPVSFVLRVSLSMAENWFHLWASLWSVSYYWQWLPCDCNSCSINIHSNKHTLLNRLRSVGVCWGPWVYTCTVQMNATWFLVWLRPLDVMAHNGVYLQPL